MFEFETTEEVAAHNEAYRAAGEWPNFLLGWFAGRDWQRRQDQAPDPRDEELQRETTRGDRLRAMYEDACVALDERDAQITSLREAGNTVSAYVYAMQNPGTIPIHVRMAMKLYEDLEADAARMKRAAAPHSTDTTRTPAD